MGASNSQGPHKKQRHTSGSLGLIFRVRGTSTHGSFVCERKRDRERGREREKEPRARVRLGRIKGCVDREVRSETSKGSLRPPAGLLAPGCAYNRVQVHAVYDGIACREREKPLHPIQPPRADQRQRETSHHFQPPRADLMPRSEGQDHRVRPYILIELRNCVLVMLRLLLKHCSCMIST